jgi:predicted Zn-dependent protease
MTTTLRNRLTNQQQGQIQLEAKVMLAAVTLQYAKNAPAFLKAAGKKALEFWAKIGSPKAATKLEVSLAKIDGAGKHLAYYTTKGILTKNPRRIVVLDEADYGKDKGAAFRNELFETIAHEMGHAFGLGHKNADNTIMGGKTNTKQVLSKSQIAVLKRRGVFNVK